MNPRKEAAYRMLSLIAAVIFVLPCIVLVFRYLICTWTTCGSWILWQNLFAPIKTHCFLQVPACLFKL